jgi:hypothetical protein
MKKTAAPAKRRYPKEEIARRGGEIYERDIEPHLNAKDKGKFVAIDIETGEFEIDADQAAASHRLRERIPQSQTWLLRVGSSYVHRFGSQLRQAR